MEKRIIIIVGAGPAGVSTALSIKKITPELASDVLVLEKAKHPRHKLCGGGVTAFAEEILNWLGIQAKVPGFPIHKVCILFGKHPLFFERENLLRIVRREDFDAELASHARHAGVEIHEEEPVQNITQSDGGIVVTTEKNTYHTKILIGADGANSFVRKKIAPANQSRVSRLLEVLVKVDRAKTPEFTEHLATFDFRDLSNNLQGYSWDFPTLINNESYLNTGIFDSRVHTHKQPANLKSLLLRKLQDKGLDDNVKIMGHPERWFVPNGVYSRPHVLLVGDAAGVEPLLGEGISIALGYGPVAAEAVKNAFATNDFSLSTYNKLIMDNRLGRLLNRNRRIAHLVYSKGFRPFLFLCGKVLEFRFKLRSQKFSESEVKSD